MPNLLTGQEVRGLFRISKATYLRWIENGTLRGVKVGGQWRFREADIQAMLQGE
jgi:excisionase family DNA binding protein